MTFILFLANAAGSAINTGLFVATGNEGSAGAAVFCGLVALFISTDRVR